MQILVLILTIFIFIKTLMYGVYEIKQKNVPGGITVICMAIAALIFPNVMIIIRGVY